MANDSERMRDPMSQPNDEDYARVAELQQPAPKLLSEEEHCKDCCCARSWKALGVTAYDGKSIPDHITALTAKLERCEAALETIAGFAVGNGDVCEIIAKRARAALRGEGS